MSTSKRTRLALNSDSESSGDESGDESGDIPEATTPNAPTAQAKADKDQNSKSQQSKQSDARQRIATSTQELKEKRKKGKMKTGPETKLQEPSVTSIANMLRSRTPIPEGNYTQEERIVSEFQRFHPMCNAISRDVLQKISEMVERVPIRVPELPVVGKSYEDMHLRPPNGEIGERPCVSGDDCLCRFLARLRYGESDPRGFVGVEFLLPAQRDRWQCGHGLPERQGKCLLCQRYWTTRLYLMARSNPSFRMGLGGKFLMQTHSNPVIERDPSRSILKGLDGSQELPTHVNTVNCVDGYIPDAMLYADEEFVQSHTSREGNASALIWKPVVRFDSSHYRYVMGESGPFIVQVGIGMDLNSSPSSGPSGPTTAAMSTDATMEKMEKMGKMGKMGKKKTTMKHSKIKQLPAAPTMMTTDQESIASFQTQLSTTTSVV